MVKDDNKQASSGGRNLANITNIIGSGRGMLVTVGGSYQRASVTNIWWKANIDINQEANNERVNDTTTRSSSSSIDGSSSKASVGMMMLPNTRKARLQSRQHKSLSNSTWRETSSIPDDNNKQARLQSLQHESLDKSMWWETGTVTNDDNKRASGRCQRCRLQH